MKGINLATIQAEDAINDELKDRPWRFGYKHTTNFSLENSGVWVDLPGGNRLWRLEIIAPEALTINLLLDNFQLPNGAHLYLSDIEKTNRVGAYTSRNNNPDKQLGTELVHGDHIVVEYFEPKNVLGQGSFTISSVVHGYRSLNIVQNDLLKALNSAGGCNIDVNCNRTQPNWYNLSWQDQIRSVAMVVVSGNGICSGALINNTCNDGTPYFLTANHCLGGGGGTSQWAFRFNWDSPSSNLSCASGANSADPGPPYDQTANGATVLVSGTQADHALLQITNMTITDAQNWNAFYAGWNRDDTESAITGVVGIHHPKGDVKKICRADDGGSNNIYHNNSGSPSAAVWYINSWTEGVTEPGSSGSPLFDQNGRIIGQLYGGAAACSGNVNNGQHDYYGRLGVSWALGINNYLAPASCGTAPLVLDGYNPNAPTVSEDAGLEAITSPSGNICGTDTVTPVVRIKNFGTNTLTSATITYNINGGVNHTYNWTGSLALYATEDVTLPSITTTTGTHTLNVSISMPNGVTDPNSSNDALTQSFSSTVTGNSVQLELTTDCWGYETFWELRNDQNVAIHTGGNTSGIPPGGGQSASNTDPGAYSNETTITEDWCLDDGCYDFIIYDDYADGISGSSSCSTNGSYTISRYGNTLVNGDGNFGASDTLNFCVNTSSVNEISFNDFKVYPNPNNGQFNIELFKENHLVSKIYITDLTGRIVFVSEDVSKKMNINLSDKSNGTYFLHLVGENSKAVTKIVLTR